MQRTADTLLTPSLDSRDEEKAVIPDALVQMGNQGQYPIRPDPQLLHFITSYWAEVERIQ